MQLLSSLLDVPAQLALVLSLAASTATSAPPSAPPANQLAVSGPRAAVIARPIAGPYRFSEDLWLRALKESLPQQGISQFAEQIFKTSGGRYYVPRASERRTVLKGRYDPKLSQYAAHAFALSNARAMRSVLERAPTPGELYIAHVFGPEGAAKLMMLARSKPDASAAEHLPDLAQSAPGLVYAGRVPRTLAQVYTQLRNALLRQLPDAATGRIGAFAPGPLLQLKPPVADESKDSRLAPATPAMAVAWRTMTSATSRRSDARSAQ